MTNQPEWELVANLGDVDVVSYGGFLVYRDTTGVYPPEAELYEPNENENGGMVYRFPLDPPRFKTLTDKGKSHGYSSRELPASERNDTWYWHNEWYVDRLDSVASTCGVTKFQLLRMLLGNDPVQRGLAYQCLIANFGAFEFDNYPLELSDHEARERYAKVAS